MSVNVNGKKKHSLQELSVEASLYINEKNNNPILIAIIHFLLILSGVYGTVFCFLSCFESVCDKTTAWIWICIFCIFFTFIFSFKKYFIPLFSTVIIVFCIYLFYIRDRICAGFFNTANIYLSKTKIKYTTQNFMDLLKPENAETDTRIFIICLIFLITLVLAYGIIHRNNLIMILLVTVPPLELCLYYGFIPSYSSFISLIAFFAGLFALDLSSSDSIKGKPYKIASAQCAISAATIVIGCFLLAIAYVKLSGYSRPESIINLNSSVNEYIENATIENILDDLSSINPVRSIKSGAIDHGKLGRNYEITFSNRTVLQVTYPKSNDAVYLRGFIGSVYTGDSWIELPKTKLDELTNISQHFSEENFNIYLLDSYNLSYINANISTLPQYEFNIKNISANRKYVYMPYNIVPESISNYEIMNYSYIKGDTEGLNFSGRFYDASAYYGYNKIFNDKWAIPNNDLSLYEMTYRNFVYENYLTLPDNFRAVDLIFNDEYYDFITAEANDNGKSTLKEMTVFNRKLYYIKNWLRNNCEYDLKAGKLPVDEDFIDYFLINNKRGSCSHFASAAVMLCRYAGIPARYVEGYIIKPNDFLNNTEIGTIETINVTDARGHAWVEIYINGYGWYPVDFTSGYGNVQTAFTTEKIIESIGEESATEIESALISSIELTNTQSEVNENDIQQPIGTTINTDIKPDIESQSQSQSQTEIISSDFQKEEGSNKLIIIILYSIGVIIIAISTLLLRRLYIINKYKKNIIKNNNYNSAAIYVYRRFCLLLSILKLENMENLTYSGFIRKLSTSSIYFNDGIADIIVNTVLKASFGKEQIEMEEVREIYTAVKTSIKQFYNSSGFFKKLYIKYILCLI